MKTKVLSVSVSYPEKQRIVKIKTISDNISPSNIIKITNKKVSKGLIISTLIQELEVNPSDIIILKHIEKMLPIQESQ